MFSFSFLYLFYLVGLVYTTNFQYAREDLETKFSILLFPLIFATSGFPLFSKKEWWIILRVFAAGCIAGSLLLIGRGFYNTFFLHQPGSFYYTGLSWSFHPGYYSMYLTFAISNILYSLLIRRSVHGFLRLAGHFLILLFFTMMIVLLSSKAGLLIWLSAIGFYTVILLFRYHRWLAGLTVIASAMAVFIAFLLIFPHAAGRVSQAKQDMSVKNTVQNPAQSTGERIAVLKVSGKIIMQHFLFGVGTGDVKDALMEQYKENNLEQVLAQKLNAHNQFIQSFITLGIFGLVLLAAMFVAPAISAFRQEYWIYFAFLFIAGISMCFESMLETQAGVVFYALFNALLYAAHRPDASRDPLDIAVRQV
jgi:O-antigen ligase